MCTVHWEIFSAAGWPTIPSAGNYLKGDLFRTWETTAPSVGRCVASGQAETISLTVWSCQWKKKRKKQTNGRRKKEEREWTERKRRRRREIHADDTLCVCIRALFTQGKSFRRDATSSASILLYRQVYIYSLLVWPLLLAVKRVPANLCPHLSTLGKMLLLLEPNNLSNLYPHSRRVLYSAD